MTEAYDPQAFARTWLEENQATFMTRYSSLDTALGYMRRLKLTEFAGHSLAELTRLRNYAGRTCFTRSLTLSASTKTYSFSGYGAWAGCGPFPDQPGKNLTVNFNLKSIDEVRELKITLDPHVKRAELTKGFSLQVQELTSYHYARVHATRKPRGKGARHSQSQAYSNAIKTAYREHGPDGVWIVLDKAWAEMFCRPPHLITTAMNPQEVAMRYLLLEGQCVRALGTGPDYLTGKWLHMSRDETGTPRSVLLERFKDDVSQGHTEIPVAELRDIHPYPVLGTRGLV